jgi:predicted CoA-binding protein
MTESDVLKRYRNIAVVGLSNDPARASLSVAKYMQDHGYRIIPVNPAETEVLGEKAYPDLAAVPEPVEIVDLFKRSEHVPPFVDQAIAIGAKVIWMQSGISNSEAAAKAREAGLEVIQDTCIRTAHRRLMASDADWASSV